ncbi:hypothetical protein LWI29_032110 [Acer saccharum]|uniref:Uncharacterized protein n=1 Tax=Acer saccharum TaxID=4024 RepID=A0AA39VYX4_ACESA|nr:hypothetical protein LWI29_032110 [Acer saccharum]
MTSLQHIYLYENQIDGIDAEAFTNICSLKTLYLRSNNLTVQLSDLLFNLSDCTKGALESLTLAGNMLYGSLPDFTEFISLKKLDIRYNRLNAITPTSIGQPLKLELLDISSNSLEGTIMESHVSNLSELKFLYLSSNLLLTLNFSSGWVPSFQLQTISLGTCKLGIHFPKWLQTQKNFSVLDFSNNHISDTIPTWFWDLSHNLVFLDLSYNHMKGMLPDLSLKFVRYPGIDLSSNDFVGPIPLVPSNVTSLNLSKNKFSGSISFLCSVRGETFKYLDLSDNLLAGELPNCSLPFENLIVLNLANNNFSGKFLDLMGSTCSIQSLNLRNNNFVGELPRSLNMCNGLKIFNVGDNNFSGTIPTWIGDSLPNLIVLAFRSNRFNGSIPLQLCQLSNIQLVDFSLNNISGTIPKCLNNLTVMVQKLSSASTISITYNYYYSSHTKDAFEEGSEFIKYWAGVQEKTEWALCFCVLVMSVWGFQMPIFSGCFLYV